MKPYVRFFFKGNEQRWADVPLPDGVSFVQYMAQIYFEGFVCSSHFYIPVDQIKMACPIQRSEGAQGIDYTKSHLQ